MADRLRNDVVNTGSKYKANHRVFENFRAKFFGKNKEQFFEVPPSVLDKRFKKFPSESADHKKEAEREEIAPATEKAKRTPKPFAEESKQAQYAAAKQVRESYEAPAILLAAAQTQSLAGKKDASFVMIKIGSKTGLTVAKARAAIVKPPEK
jgi:hypothetical protein